MWEAGAKGCKLATSGQLTGIISAAALSFMVHEPSGIIARSSARSLVGELAQEAHHVGLGAVLVEHGLCHEAVAAAASGQAAFGLSGHLGAEKDGERRQIVLGRGLVEGDADMVGPQDPQQPPAGLGTGGDLLCLSRCPHRHRIEEALAGERKPCLGQAIGEPGGQPMQSGSDRLKAVRPVPDRIACRHVGQQRLGGADVGGGLVATDVLLARLQRQPIGRPAVRIGRLPDQAAGH